MDGNLQDGERSWGVGGGQGCNYRSYRSSFASGANKEQGGEKHTITIPSVAFNSRGAQTSLILFFFFFVKESVFLTFSKNNTEAK